jgi:hypothetical protein
LFEKLERFCEGCEDPITSRECAEVWGRIVYWDEDICEPDGACRKRDEYCDMRDRMDELVGEMRKAEEEVA